MISEIKFNSRYGWMAKFKAQVTTTCMTQIMFLVNLAPEIQEAILFLPRVESGPDTAKEIKLRRIAPVMGYGVQRGRWSGNL